MKNKRNEKQLAQETTEALESRDGRNMTIDEQADFELGQMLRRSAHADLPARNPELRKQLLAEVERMEDEKVIPLSTTAKPKRDPRQRWALATAAMVALGGWGLYQLNSQASPNEVAINNGKMKDQNVELDKESENRIPQDSETAAPGFDRNNIPPGYRIETRTRTVPVTRMRPEAQSRTVPAIRHRTETRTETLSDGSTVEKEVTVPYIEQVAQNYTVQVPHTEAVVQKYEVLVPNKGKSPSDESLSFGDGKLIGGHDYGGSGIKAVESKTSEPHGVVINDEPTPNPANDYMNTDLPGEAKQPIADSTWQQALGGQSDRPSSGPTGQQSGEQEPAGQLPQMRNAQQQTQGRPQIDPSEFASGGEVRLQGAGNGKSPGGDVFQPTADLDMSQDDPYSAPSPGTLSDGNQSTTPASEAPGRFQTVVGGSVIDSSGISGGTPSPTTIPEFLESPKSPGQGHAGYDRSGSKGESYELAELNGKRGEALRARNTRLYGLSLNEGKAEAKKRLEDQLEDEVVRFAYKNKVDAWDRYEKYSITQEQYEPIHENKFIAAKGAQAMSTFSIDVDTASYANMRRFIKNGSVPPPNAVRIEELINYFDYNYPQPKGDDPFSVNMELAACPWNEGHKLLRVGLKGKDVHVNERPATNVVFLIDVSGSMSSNDKLPLLKRSFQMMVRELNENDRISIVTYAGNAGCVLEPTTGEQTQRINEAIEQLSPGGSTHGSAGIELAYKLAQKNFIQGGVNKVILATDGDLNVGITDDNALVKLITEKASEGVFLTTLGFGTGNLKDSKLEKLADNGNGMYAYIDGIREAKKVLVDQLSGSLMTIAKDVKIQIEFNPAEVAAYRLIGYENRMLATRDFDNDKKDAGEIGAGHTVTAIYELVTKDENSALSLPPKGMKYQSDETTEMAQPADENLQLSAAANSGDLLTLALRYKQPDENVSKRIEFTIENDDKSFSGASSDFRFAASVASFGMILRGSQHAGNASPSMVEDIASGAFGEDSSGYRAEFIDLVRRVRGITGR